VVLECLRRLEQQTFTDFDVVLVDDGSADGTAAKVAEFAASSPLRLKVISKPNGGLGKARNRGMQEVTAPLTLLLGQDVWTHPDFVERHVLGHEQNPDERLVVLGLSRYYDASRKVTPFERYLETQGAQFSYGHLRHGDRVDWHYFYTGNVSGKTEMLRKYPSNENIFFLEDTEWGYRMAQDGGLIVLYDAHAIGDHYHPADVAWSLERAYQVGQHARVLVAEVPALREEFEVKGSPARLGFYCWLARRHGFWRVAARIMHRLSTRWAMGWFAGKALRLYFYAGYEGLPKP
jgi:GT2 family glycosyltransferase